jgi:outer membrane lipoprotein-sorting protein
MMMMMMVVVVLVFVVHTCAFKSASLASANAAYNNNETR